MIDFSPSGIRVDDFIQSTTEQLAELTFNKVSYALSQAQATEIVRLAVAARRRPPEFSFYSDNTSSRAEAHNCTSFILSLLNQVGVNVGSRSLHSSRSKTQRLRQQFEPLVNQLNYQFNNIHLLEQALTRPSAMNEDCQSDLIGIYQTFSSLTKINFIEISSSYGILVLNRN